MILCVAVVLALSSLSSVLVHGMYENKTPVIVQISNNIPDTTIFFRAYCKTLYGEHVSVGSGHTKGVINGAAVSKFPIIPVWELYLIANPDAVLYECKQDGQIKKGIISYSKDSSGYAHIFDKDLEVWGCETTSNICVWDPAHSKSRAGWHQGKEIQES